MAKHWLLTYDIGTTGNKCTLFDEIGIQHASHTVSYETAYPKPGWAEQDPEDFWSSLVEGTRILLRKSGINPAEVAGIGLSGHMNGFIAVDRNGEVLHPDILHSDSRSGSECATISAIVSPRAYYRITGSRLDAHFTLPKMLWFKNRFPDLYARTAYVLASKDYVSFRLTGVLGRTDYSDAGMTGMLDITRRAWAEPMLRSIGLDPAKLPLLQKSSDIVGTLTPSAARQTGLPSGIPVVTGGGDAACATRGSGTMRNGNAYAYIGSSAWIAILNNEPVFDAEARTFNFPDLDGENVNVCGTMQCATIAYDWVVNNLAADERRHCRDMDLNLFDHLDEMAARVPAGANGVMFMPWLMGERTPLWDENARGGFIGISLKNKREDLIRASYEGIAYSLRSVLEAHRANGLDPKSLTFIGGGAISRVWNEIMCSVLDKPVIIRKNPRESTSLGAAMAAGVGVGLFRNYSDFMAGIAPERQFDPDPELAEIYRGGYALYSRLHPQLKGILADLATWQDGLRT